MRDAIRWFAGQPELLNALAPFALLALCGAVAAAILAFAALQEWIEAHPAGSRARQLLAAGIVSALVCAALTLFAFLYLYAVNWRAVLAPSCEPVRYLAGV